MENKLYNVEQSRSVDKKAIQDFNISGALLMQRAGFVIFKNIPNNYKNITIFIGAGNNGGDGIAAAFFSAQENLNVTVIHVPRLDSIHGDAKVMLSHAKSLGVKFEEYHGDYQIPKSNELIVDALFGTGLNKKISGVYQDVITKINSSNNYVIAADIPSGICAETGKKLHYAVKADKTCTFVCYKKGLFTSDATNCVGELILDDLYIPFNTYVNVDHEVDKLDIKNLRKKIKKRLQNTHKGSFGNLVIIAGDKGMAGAAIMNSISALKVGAGKVHLITHPDHSNVICVNIPEVMSHGVDDEEQILSLCEDASAVLIGSGMNINLKWSHKLFKIISSMDKPIIADAGMLDYLKSMQNNIKNLIITPHPGEASRLLDVSNEEINDDRFYAAKKLSLNYNCTAVLKGKGTLIQSINPDDKPCLCPYGNPSMATAGMGDVLAGMIAGLKAQHYSSFDAVKIGVALHSYTADELVYRKGYKQLIASDIYQNLWLVTDI